MKETLLKSYSLRLSDFLRDFDWDSIIPLATALRSAIVHKKSVYICNNGGSAANTVHLADDFLYGIAKDQGMAMKVEALAANTSVVTCLSKDIGYSEVFSRQLRVKASKEDILLIFSGSGESANVVRALEVGHQLQMKTFAIVGYGRGKCKRLADYAIHFPINDMQGCEDLQMVVGHMIMQWLIAHPIPDKR
jgi:D-sedoheptulose 7-phosphate isomerase